MTAEDVIKRAWDMVGDVGINKRNRLITMIDYVNDAIRDLRARRPQLTLSNVGINIPYDDLILADYCSTNLSISDDYRESLAHYVAYRIFELDESDENNRSSSQMHFKQYLQRT